jgi:hypothetical protein
MNDVADRKEIRGTGGQVWLWLKRKNPRRGCLV